jgi:hypothetical protein
MLKQARHWQRKPRYEAGPFKGNGDRSWMVYDDLVGRLVAFPLQHHEACTLAHTLNVADLGVPMVDFDRDR